MEAIFIISVWNKDTQDYTDIEFRQCIPYDSVNLVIFHRDQNKKRTEKCNYVVSKSDIIKLADSLL